MKQSNRPGLDGPSMWWSVAAAVAALAGLLAWGIAPARAEEPIATDRPDFVESSDTVGRGRAQIETSLAWERDRAKGTRTTLLSTPTLLRLGVSEDWELRLESDGRQRQRTRAAALDTTQQGWADASLGVKWHMRDGEGAAPGVAWLLHADLDSGSAAFRGEGMRPSVRVVMEWELDENWSAGLMPGLAWEKANGNRYAAGIFGAVLGRSLSETTRVFAELALPHIAAGRHGGTQATFDFGAAWLLTSDVQIDLSAARGLNHRTPDWSAGIGLSVRF